MKKLYLLSTYGMGDFYVIAEDPTHAQDSLETILNKADYGFSKDRKVINIRVLSNTITGDIDNINLSPLDNRLLIVSDWI